MKTKYTLLLLFLTCFFLNTISAQAQLEFAPNPAGFDGSGAGYSDEEDDEYPGLIIGTTLYVTYEDNSGIGHLAKYENNTLTIIPNPTGYNLLGYAGKGIVMGSNLFLQFRDNGGNFDLLRYDGTSFTIIPSPAGYENAGVGASGDMFVLGNTLYCVYGNNTSNSVLVKYDGTTLTPIPSPTGYDGTNRGCSNNFASIGTTLYVRYTSNGGNLALAKYDGTNLTIVTNLAGYTGNGTGVFDEFNIIGTSLYFMYRGSDGNFDLGKYDGTTLSVIPSPVGYENNNVGVQYIEKINTTLYISMRDNTFNNDLALYDGTTLTIIPSPTGYENGSRGYVGNVVEFGGNIYMSYTRNNSSQDLAKFDGTNLTFIPATFGSLRNILAVTGGNLYMNYETTTNNRSLAKYDGTTLTQIPSPTGYDAIGKGVDDDSFLTSGNALYLKYRKNNNSADFAKYDGSTLTITPSPTGYDAANAGYSERPIQIGNTIYLRYSNNTGNNVLAKYLLVADLCASAIPLTCGVPVTGSTAGSTVDNVGTCVTTNTSPGVWYKIAGNDKRVTLSLCGSGYDTKISVFSGACGALTCVTGNDDFCGLQSQTTFTATSGTDYYILVHGFGAASGNFTLTPTCCDVPLQVTGINFGTITSNSIELSNFSAPASGVDGYVIKINDGNFFTVPADGSSPTANLAWQNTGEQVAYNGTSSTPNITVTGLAQGTTYTFKVYAYQNCSTNPTYEIIGTTATATTLTSNTITLGTITPTTTCAGTTISVPFTTSGTFGGSNTFTAELSDNTGSFTTPTVSQTGTNPISLTVPSNATASTNYRIRVRSSAPATTSANSGAITINNPAVTLAIPTTSFCINAASFALTGGSPTGGTYTGTGVTTNSFNPTTAGTGNHLITYSFTDGNGCTNTATQTITVNPLPTVTLAIPTTTFCVNAASFALTGGSPTGGTYTGTGVTTNSFNPTTAGTGNHLITYSFTDANGCTNTATQTITVNPLPTVNLNIPNASLICISTPSFTLTGGSPTGGTYTGTGITAGDFDPTTAGIGTHLITYSFTDANGCQNTATENIIVNNTPCPAIGGGGGTVTIAAPTNLRATVISTTQINLSWSASANASSYLIFVNNIQVASQNGTSIELSSLLSDTFYTFKVIATNGNINSEPSQTNARTFPAAPVLLSVSEVCGNGQANVNLSSSGVLYRVYSNSTSTTPVVESTNANFLLPSISQATIFYVSVVSNGVESTRTAISVTVLPSFDALILGEPVQYSCESSLNLNALSVENATYTWLFNGIEAGTGQDFIATRSGNYQVRVERQGCTQLSDFIRLTLNYAPIARIAQGNSINNTINFCESGILEAREIRENTTYEWFLNNISLGTDTEITVSSSGTYTLEVTERGCTATAQIEVTVTNLPQTISILVPDQIPTCPNDDRTYFINPINGASYNWLRNGRIIRRNTEPEITVSSAGTYRAEVILNGCSVLSEEIIFEKTPVAKAFLRNTETTLFIETTDVIENVEWSFDGEVKTELDGNTTITPTESGYYSARVIYENLCSTTTRTFYFRVKEEVILGEDEQKPATFKVYPNPSITGIFQIDFEKAVLQDSKLTVFDAIGRTVYTSTIKKGATTHQLKLQSQVSGVYILKIELENTSLNYQLLID